MDCAKALTDPSTLEFVAHACAAQAVDSAVELKIKEFRLGAIPGKGLSLEVWGDDQIGFLGRLLNMMAGFSLFPQEMAIGTEGSTIHDKFLLVGIGGQMPLPGAGKALTECLERLRPRSPASRQESHKS